MSKLGVKSLCSDFYCSNLTIVSTELDLLSITKVVDMIFIFQMALISLDSDEQLGRNHQISAAATGFQILCSNLFGYFFDQFRV
jgi:hypothetical protein